MVNLFRLICGSHEFFNPFYMQPEGAVFSLIFTQPEDSGEQGDAAGQR